MPFDSLPPPWKEFLTDLGGMLDKQLDLHCIGGFVICYFYGLPRPTGDLDYYTAVPANPDLIEMAGEGSTLAKKYKIPDGRQAPRSGMHRPSAKSDCFWGKCAPKREPTRE
jgi:hypothetical protein